MIKKAAIALWLPFAGCAPRDPAADPATFQGIVELETTDLSFEIGGRVQAILVDEGDLLESGDVVARLDETLATLEARARRAEMDVARAELDLLGAGALPEDIRAARAELSAARSRAALARRTLARLEPLARQGAATDAELDAARAELEQAEARQLEGRQRLARLTRGAREQEIAAAEARLAAAQARVRTAEERIARHRLLAGSAGLVLDVLFEPDELAVAGAPVVRMANVERPYVDVFVPQARIDEVAVGAPASVRIDAQPDALEGEVQHVARQTEFTPRFLFSEGERPNLVLRVRVRVNDPEHRLRAGVPAFVRFASQG